MVMGDIQEGRELIVIGGGPGGYVAAIRAAQLGKDVTLIDALPQLGGVCLNWGCIPSKALIHVASVYHSLDTAKDFGIHVTGKSVDWSESQSWKQNLIKKLSQGIAALCKDNGVEVIQGMAHFTSEQSVMVESDEHVGSYKFEQAIIASGSKAIEIPTLPFDDSKGIIGAKGALSLSEIPKKLAVVGGGYIGVELGTAYAKLGSQVTIVEAKERLLPEISVDLAKAVSRKLKQLGITTYVSTQANAYDGSYLSLAGEHDPIEADKVLVAVGRRPNTEELQLDLAKVDVDIQGYITVNEQGQSSQENIYAIGDVVGGMMLAHKASAEGKIAAEAICGEPSGFDNYVPAVIFSDPEVAMVGLSETQAQERGLAIQVGQFPFAALGRTVASHESDGFIKIISEVESYRILGFEMVGPHVSELISIATHLLEMGAMVDDVALTINTHPTFAEAIGEAAESIYGHAIHLSPRKQKKI